MNGSVRRLLVALAISVFVNILASIFGLYDVLLFPYSALLSLGFPNYGHSLKSALLLILFPIIVYTVVFWTFGTIWYKLREAYN